MIESLPAVEVDVLEFQVGPRRYAVDATQVLRIDPCRDHATSALSSLGPLSVGGRALVFDAGDREGRLAVDVVNGVRRCAHRELRRLPRVAVAHPYAIGFWLDGETPVVLIDLAKTVNFQGRQ